MTVTDVEELLKGEVLSVCSRLADYKRVRKFTIREDEFPKTTTRKIKRLDLKRLIDRGDTSLDMLCREMLRYRRKAPPSCSRSTTAS